MSSSNSTYLQFEANRVNYIAMMFIRCYCYLSMPIGGVGHLLSLYVLARPSLRSNPCTRYFLAATAIGIITTLYTLPMRLVQSGFVGTDPGANSVVFCKLTWFIQYSIRYVKPGEILIYFFSFRRGLAFWLIVLACGDRYLCSSMSTRMRGWSSVRMANRVIPIFALIGFLAHVHIPIFFHINIIPATQKPICYPPGPPGTYRIVLSYFTLVFFGLLPPTCMLTFGALTLQNINRSKRLIRPGGILQTAPNQSGQRSNRQILRMLLVQVFVYSVTGLGYSVPAIITAASADQPKNVLEVAQGNLITAIVGMLSNTGPCFSFYLFTLSSGLFRRELRNLFRRLARMEIHPDRSRTQMSKTGHTKRMGTTRF